VTLFHNITVFTISLSQLNAALVSITETNFQYNYNFKNNFNLPTVLKLHNNVKMLRLFFFFYKCKNSQFSWSGGILGPLHDFLSEIDINGVGCVSLILCES